MFGPRVALEMAQDEAISALRDHRVELFRRIERQRAEAPRLDLGDACVDEPPFGEPAPSSMGKSGIVSNPPPKAPPKRKRAPKVTLASAIKQAERAGRSVAGADIYADHVRLQFGPPTKAAEREDDSNPWDGVLQ